MNSPAINATVIIPTYNRYDLVYTAIDCVLNQSFSGRYEVIVVDNADPSEKGEALKAHFADHAVVSVIHQPRRGLSAARNAGIAAANGDYILFTDDDCRVDREWIKAILAAFKSDPMIDAVGGKVILQSDQPMPPWIDDLLCGFLSALDWGDVGHATADHEYLVGCNLAFRKSVLTGYGGFDENLGRNGKDLVLLSNEETKLLRSVRTCGRQVFYQPHAKVNHLVFPHRLTKEWFRRRVAWQAVSDFIEDPDKGVTIAMGFLEKKKKIRNRIFSDKLSDIFSSFKIFDQKFYSGVYELTMVCLAGLDVDREPSDGPHDIVGH